MFSFKIFMQPYIKIKIFILVQLAEFFFSKIQQISTTIKKNIHMHGQTLPPVLKKEFAQFLIQDCKTLLAKHRV